MFAVKNTMIKSSKSVCRTLFKVCKNMLTKKPFAYKPYDCKK